MNTYRDFDWLRVYYDVSGDFIIYVVTIRRISRISPHVSNDGGKSYMQAEVFSQGFDKQIHLSSQNYQGIAPHIDASGLFSFDNGWLEKSICLIFNHFYLSFL